MFVGFFNSNLKKILQGSLKLNFSGFLIIPPFSHFRGKMECAGQKGEAAKPERSTLKKILNIFPRFQRKMFPFQSIQNMYFFKFPKRSLPNLSPF